MRKYKRIFLCVIDSVGIGYDPNSEKYGDKGANTIKNIALATNGLSLPILEKMGLGNIEDIKGVSKEKNPIASYGKLMEKSIGKDTTTGHWEMMGIFTEKPFMTFTDTGFPIELITEIEEKTGYKVIGNYAASGTEIMKDLGEEHIKNKALIVYTSADSVLQIAAHEKYFGLNELYRVCEIVREICMKPKFQVARIIARPFLGESSNTFTRTSNRHDYSVSPTSKTVLDILKENNYDVIGLGKISDIFNAQGITESHHQVSNHDGMIQFTNIVKTKEFTGLCFLNLVDFDALYGHRRNPEGYKMCLEEFDVDLATFISYMSDDDLLIITADHGNDPTWVGSDHTREYVPIFIYSKTHKNPVNLKTRESFADIGATITDNFNVEAPLIGKSMKDLII